MILQACFDESGYGQSGPAEAFVFAGFCGLLTEWEHFAHEWDAILKEAPEWTATDLKIALRKNRNDSRIERLVNVIGESDLRRLQFRVSAEGYNQAVTLQLPAWRSNREIDSQVEWKYFLAIWGMTFHLFAPIRDTPEIELDIIYDENIEQRPKLEKGYADFVASQGLPLEVKRLLPKQPRPDNDQRFMPLQAADLLAWHAHRDYVATHEGREHNDSVWTALKRIRSVVDETWGIDDIRFGIRGA